MKPPKKPQKTPKSSTQHIIPFRRALMWIFLSIITISGSSYGGFLYYRDLRERQRHDPAYDIVALVQTTAEPVRLNTACIAEMLDLSIDRPTNLFCFNVRAATEKLKLAPVIKEAHINKIHPGIIHVDYTLRKPIALLADYTNTALDAEGVTFPIKPFFTPKKLPEIYLGHIDGENEESSLGNKGPSWGSALSGRRAELALSILDLLAKKYSQPLVHVSCVDVSKAFAPSCGERQIVIVLEELIEVPMKDGIQLNLQPRILRLGADNYEKQLENYFVLQKYLWKAVSENYAKTSESEDVNQPMVVDLRLSNLAFIVEEF